MYMAYICYIGSPINESEAAQSPYSSHFDISWIQLLRWIAAIAITQLSLDGEQAPLSMVTSSVLESSVRRAQLEDSSLSETRGK
jgi:hypothetical protein